MHRTFLQQTNIFVLKTLLQHIEFEVKSQRKISILIHLLKLRLKPGTLMQYLFYFKATVLKNNVSVKCKKCLNSSGLGCTYVSEFPHWLVLTVPSACFARIIFGMYNIIMSMIKYFSMVFIPRRAVLWNEHAPLWRLWCQTFLPFAPLCCSSIHRPNLWGLPHSCLVLFAPTQTVF